MTLLQASEIQSRVPLSRHTSLRLGGEAEYFAQPRSREALLELLADCHRRGVPFRVLGKGSNVLVREAGVAGLVISLARACNGWSIRDDVVNAGASVSLQRLINDAGKHGLGGMAYLYSVPGNVGGAVFMNAGRGKFHQQSIADFVETVEVFYRGEVRQLSKSECRFDYRHSVFHQLPGAVILGARLKLERQDAQVYRRQVDDRMTLVGETQDTSLPNAGTVFKLGFDYKLDLRGVSIGGARFSELTRNWILAGPDSTPNDVLRLIDLAKQRHVDRGRLPPDLEWRVW